MGLERKRKREQDAVAPQKQKRAQPPIVKDSSEQESILNSEEESASGSGSDAEEDGGQWSGFGGAMEGRKAGKKPQKPPTGEELRDIKDAMDLYQSSSFKLQVDALLPNVRPKYGRFGSLDSFLHTLYTFLTSLPSRPASHPLAALRTLQKSGIAIPYAEPKPIEEVKWTVAFEKPSEVVLVGSWPVKMSVKGKDGKAWVVDLAVEMPASLFQEKDYLNGRFFHKRAFYISVIASALLGKKSPLDVDLAWESLNDDPRMSTLVIRPKPNGPAADLSKLNIQVRILPTLPTTSPILLHRLSPNHSSIRTSSTSQDAPSSPSSPYYNNSLLLSTTPRPYLLHLHSIKESVPAFADALTLLKVWANQRGYSESGGIEGRLTIRGFEGRGAFWIGVLDVVINGEETSSEPTLGRSKVGRRAMGKGLSSYQLFKAALDFLARTDFRKERVFVKTANGAKHMFSPSDYGDPQKPVFISSISSFNLLAGVSLGSLDMLKHDAKMTLELLEGTTSSISDSQDTFHQVFLKDCRDISVKYDIIIRADLSSASPRSLSSHAILDHAAPYTALVSQLSYILQKGLTNRTAAISLLTAPSNLRPVTQPDPSYNPIIYIGLILDTENAFRLVDHGPAAGEDESEESKEFREFWGDKAELRRFKDGSITESVVWEVSTADQRTQIPSFIVQHLLVRHIGIKKEDLQTWQPSYDGQLRLPESVSEVYKKAGVGIGWKTALTAFDNLVKSIKALDDELPLAVLNVSPVSESLRYTSVFSPVALPEKLLNSGVLPSSSRYINVMEIVIEFEGSTRWPDDLVAIQKIKLAFLETLGSSLMKSVSGLKAFVALADTDSYSDVNDIQDRASLEVYTPEGWAFRARIHHERESTLLDQLIDDKPHIPKAIKRKLQQAQGVDPESARLRQRAIEAKGVFIRRYVHAPRHHRTIAALSHRFSAYAGTVRLVKRWLAAHWLLRGHISEEVVELLCARVFLGGKEDVPGTKERGFARVVELLKDWEWEKGIFVSLDASSEDSTSKPDEEANPSVSDVITDKDGVWAVRTEFDASGHVWTSAGPDAVVARRVRAIAKATFESLRQPEFDVKTLFVHPTDHYDFLIKLDPGVLPRYCQNIVADPSVWQTSGKYANAILANDSSDEPIRLGFDPAWLLFSDLKRVYKDTFKLFFDPLGGDTFGAIWDPTLREPRPFRVLGGFSSIPTQNEAEKPKDKHKDKGLVVLNADAVLSEVERLGVGIIKGITIHV